MNISSTKRHQNQAPVTHSPGNDKKGVDENQKPAPPDAYLGPIPLTEATVEIPEVLLGLSGLQQSTSSLGDTLRSGVSLMALANASHAFQHGEGVMGKIEGLSSLGLAVAGGASVLDGQTTLLRDGPQSNLGRVGEGVHGLCEVALGTHEMMESIDDTNTGLNLGVVSGMMGVTKGLTTFLPMMMPSAGTAVGILHLGILVSKTAISKLESNP